MWDRLRATAAAAGLNINNNAQRHPHHSHLQNSVHQKRRLTIHGAGSHVEKADWRDTADPSHDHLEITSLQYKYDDSPLHGDVDEATQLAADTVHVIPRLSITEYHPRSQAVGHVDLDDDLISEASFCEPPPRNPRRLLPQHQPCRPSSSLYEDIIVNSDTDSTSDTDGDTSSTASSYKLASLNMYGRPALEQISPPSSPDVSALRDCHLGDDVSPIDDEADMAQQHFLKGARHTQYQNSAIPVRRREPSSFQHGFGNSASVETQLPTQGSLPQSHGAMFSSTSDERISSSHDQTYVVGQETSAPTSQNRHSSFGQRVRNFGRSKAQPVDTRPPWHGASGRSSILPSLHNNTDVAPLIIPRKSSKRTGRLRGSRIVTAPLSPPFETFSPEDATAERRASLDLESHSPFESHGASNSQPYPSPPHYDYQTLPSQAGLSNGVPQTESLSGPNSTNNSTNAIRRRPPPSGHRKVFSDMPNPLRSSPVHWNADGRTLPPPAGNSVAQDTQIRSTAQDSMPQPLSRFSVTTYATSNAETPHQPAERKFVTPPPRTSSSMSNTRHEHWGNTPEEKSSTPEPMSLRPPFMSGPYSGSVGDLAVRSQSPSTFLDLHTSRNSKPKERPSSIMSMSKPLPPAPYELMPSNDRVAQLTAQLSGLAHRRLNINKSIKQMTKFMPNDNLMASDKVLRKREAEKQKVEGLKEELSQVQREEYDLGLKLHRAYKRMDNNAEYEPTTLWVRRITG